MPWYLKYEGTDFRPGRNTGGYGLWTDCYVIGDAVWDLLAARRAGMLSIGLLSGGYGDDELTRAGAFRVFRDTAELHNYLDELGVLP